MVPKIEFLVRPHMVDKCLSNTRKYDIFHPSAWGSCHRRIAYQYYNDQKRFKVIQPHDVDQRMERIFDNGHFMHDRWQSYLAKSDILRGLWVCTRCKKRYGNKCKLGCLFPKGPRALKSGETPCSCDEKYIEYEELLVRSKRYNFEGHVDAVIDLRGTHHVQNVDSEVFVVDFKSMKDDYFSDLRQAKHEHIVQVNIYMWLLGLGSSIVLYENKDNQNVKEMEVPKDDDLISRIKDDASLLIGILKHGKLPKKPSGMSRSAPPCRFCEFKEICYS